MNKQIKINDPHIYYRVRKFVKKHFGSAENMVIVAILLATIVVVVRAFIEADAILRLSMVAIFFAATTFFLLMAYTARSVENESN